MFLSLHNLQVMNRRDVAMLRLFATLSLRFDFFLTKLICDETFQPILPPYFVIRGTLASILCFYKPLKNSSAFAINFLHEGTCLSLCGHIGIMQSI